MTRDDLEQLWEVIGRPASVGEFAGRRLADRPMSRGAYAVVDHLGRRGLFLQLPSDARGVEPVTTAGLSVLTDQFRIGGGDPGRYIALTCLRQEQVATFGSLCVDVLRETLGEEGCAAGRVEAILNRWKVFWRVQSTSLSREAALGLFGELWFLHHWLMCD